MKNVLSADFFEFRKSKMTFLLPLIAILLGFAIPLMYFGLCEMIRYLSSLDILADDPSFASAAEMLKMLNANTVFLSALPLSQGIGIVITALVGFRAVRPFSTGVYRNKVIAQIPRSAIYLSQSLYCLLLTMVSACLYTLSAALASELSFGGIHFSGREIAVIALLSAGIYLVYTAIPVFIAFLTRSVPMTILFSILLPILAQTVISIIAAALMNAPQIVSQILCVLPSVQNVYMMNAEASDTVLAVSLASDAAIAALLTFLGMTRFRRTDVK